jgi:hypothetical protein
VGLVFDLLSFIQFRRLLDCTDCLFSRLLDYPSKRLNCTQSTKFNQVCRTEVDFYSQGEFYLTEGPNAFCLFRYLPWWRVFIVLSRNVYFFLLNLVDVSRECLPSQKKGHSFLRNFKNAYSCFSFFLSFLLSSIRVCSIYEDSFA